MEPFGPAGINCPQCGAPAPFRGTAVSLVCEYCNSTIVRTNVNVRLVGQVSAIVDNGSPILLGARGRWKGVPFTVAGRLQVAYGRGTWNEWYLEFADKGQGWLADAQGMFAILRPRDPSVVADALPPYAEIAIGSVLVIKGTSALVVDKRSASYRGAEGILPFEAEPGHTFSGIDLRGFEGEFITLDYGHHTHHRRPLPFVGQAASLASLQLHPLRTFAGWPRPAAPRSA